MPRGKAPQVPLGFGLRPVSGTIRAEPQMDPVEKAIVDATKRIGQSGALGALVRLASGEEGAAMPQPASVQDMIALSGEARKAASELAAHANKRAEDEEKRRTEAEQRAATAYDAGQEEAEGRWTMMLGIVQENNKTILELVKDKHTAEAAAMQQQQTEILKRIEDGQKAALAAKDAALAQEQEKREAAERKAAELEKRRTWQEEFAEAWAKNDDSHPMVAAVRRAFVPNTPQGAQPKTPEQIYAERIAEGAANHQVNVWGLEEEGLRKKNEQSDLISRGISDLLPAARRALTAPPQPQGRPSLDDVLAEQGQL